MVKIAVYIDESRSMSESLRVSARSMTKVQIASEIWNEAIVPVISGYSSRVRSIDSRGASRELLRLDAHGSSDLQSLVFRGTGAHTYLWEFLVDEATNFDQGDDWVVVLISDGEDNASSPPYKGIQGIEPCIKKIREMGHKPDFHIIGLNLASDDASARFKLSGSTGGSFFNITNTTDFNDILSQIRAELIENIDPTTRERAIRSKQKEYAQTPEARAGDGPVIDYRDEDSFPSSPMSTRYGRGLDSLTDSNLEDWHLRALVLLGHVPYGPIDQNLISSWTPPEKNRKNKKHWKSIALDYGGLASRGGSNLLDMIQQILEMKREHKRLKILIRSGPGPANKDVENFLDTLIDLGIEVIRLPNSAPPWPLPIPDDPSWPMPPDGPGPSDRDSDWNFIPSNDQVECRRFLMVQPLIHRKYSQRFPLEEAYSWCADYPNICNRDREFYDSLGEDCKDYFHDIDLDAFGKILIRTLQVVYNCYQSKKVMRQLWFVIPHHAIDCGILESRQWLLFWDDLQQRIAKGPYPLEVFINGMEK